MSAHMLLVFIFALFSSCAASYHHTQSERPSRANHIFNAIHSSMRQWGSSLNHNGMSFFIAHVPEDTLLYHGRSSNETVTGMEWVAFEPEHAILFARSRPHRKKPPGPRPGSHPRQDHGQGGSPPHRYPHFQHPPNEHQQPLLPLKSPPISADNDPPDHEAGGWLHTLSTRRDLRLLYIDGMAAGKSTRGTLDSTDLVLLNRTSNDDSLKGPAGGDFTRARLLCSLAQNQWSGKVDGFIRMETGFEIILCSFADSLVTVRKSRTEPFSSPASRTASFNTYLQAVTSRYDGIGSGRVVLAYESMVTSFGFPIDLFCNGSVMPRLNGVHHILRSHIFDSVESSVLQSDMMSSEAMDWQAITDMIVNRWGKELMYLASNEFITLEAIHAEIEALYRPFIDYDHRGDTAEITRCVAQHMPSQFRANTASNAVADVAQRICRDLHSVLNEMSIEAAASTLSQLVQWLQWPVWQRCSGCVGNEICFIAMWPFGSTQDHSKPSCLPVESIRERDGYWGDMGPVTM